MSLTVTPFANGMLCPGILFVKHTDQNERQYEALRLHTLVDMHGVSDQKKALFVDCDNREASTFESPWLQGRDVFATQGAGTWEE